MNVLLRLSGTDIIIGVSVLDNDGNSVTASQVVEVSIQRKSDDKWWTGAAWATGAEPAMVNAPQVGTTGIYEYTLTAGFDDNTPYYTVHIEGTVVVLRDFYDNYMLLPDVIQALQIDTHAEVGQEAPAATQSILKMIQFLYKAWRNKKVQDISGYELYNDAGAVVDQKSTSSDDGSDTIVGEVVSGP